MKKKKLHKTNAIRILEKEEIAYDVHEYPWSEDHLDAITVAEKVAMPMEKIYKTLITKGDKTGITVACIPANHTLDLKAFAKVSGNKKLEMLPMKELELTTGYIRGGCSPIGMKKSFPTYIANIAQSMETVIVSAGKRGMQVELTPGDLQKVTDAVFSDFTIE
ncbi:Cys-tRNA(Pro) deacylase [Oceanobacillus arenosus]|uniref:Cys-tRNA(Pro)/Cys-tRNA(Cys) deacylase n=1 Tax=Oceanobacillus arenosus TaxID=1229153 RepID=A0A3D8PK50_9BACI|nr:Cys-tRNA(Pro) deacylase [Oceanobacillus arenosus]RDW16424.1 Cys-tRNA(Pro) deacylase [Oceanobacillus arenosus]